MTRALRLARNETFFREVNEQVEQEITGSVEQRFFCECSTRGCVDRITLTKYEYEHVRAESDQFFVVPGHENAEVEFVVERMSAYWIVAKFGTAGDYANQTDPRE